MFMGRLLLPSKLEGNGRRSRYTSTVEIDREMDLIGYTLLFKPVSYWVTSRKRRKLTRGNDYLSFSSEDERVQGKAITQVCCKENHQKHRWWLLPMDHAFKITSPSYSPSYFFHSSYIADEGYFCRVLCCVWVIYVVDEMEGMNFLCNFDHFLESTDEMK